MFKIVELNVIRFPKHYVLTANIIRWSVDYNLGLFRDIKSFEEWDRLMIGLTSARCN